MLIASQPKVAISKARKKENGYLSEMKTHAACVARELRAVVSQVDIVSIALWDRNIYNSRVSPFPPATSFAVSPTDEVLTITDTALDEKERDVLNSLGAYTMRSWEQEFSRGLEE